MAYASPHGESAAMPSVAATDAKKEFGRVLDRAIRGGPIVITKHDRPTAVLMSIEEFTALARASETRLNRLSVRFDAMLDRMQTATARSGMKAAFEASPKRLGAAAVAHARKRG